MGKLVMAMGAEHVKPHTMKQIIDKICEENELRNYDISNSGISVDDYVGYIHSRYLIPIDKINVFKYSYAIETKYDGFSYLSNGGRFFSKGLSKAKGSEGMPIEKTSHVPHLSRILESAENMAMCTLDLHGELCMGDDCISDDISTIMGCTPDEAVIRQSNDKSKVIRYRLFDIREFRGISTINEPYRVRRAILEYVYNTYIDPIDRNMIMLSELHYGNPNKIFDEVVANGGEGIIIKNADGKYIPGKKPANNWIKGKKKITHDVFMVGLNKGTGKNIDTFGSIKFAHMVDGKQVTCGNCAGMSEDIRQYIYENMDELLDKKQVFEIEAMQESIKSFRNAVFLRLRDDKSWDECNPIDIRVRKGLTVK